MITIKNESQIEKMRRAGALLHSGGDDCTGLLLVRASRRCTWIRWPSA